MTICLQPSHTDRDPRGVALHEFLLSRHCDRGGARGRGRLSASLRPQGWGGPSGRVGRALATGLRRRLRGPACSGPHLPRPRQLHLRLSWNAREGRVVWREEQNAIYEPPSPASRSTPRCQKGAHSHLMYEPRVVHRCAARGPGAWRQRVS
jgi:hypothetical protein